MCPALDTTLDDELNALNPRPTIPVLEVKRAYPRAIELAGRSLQLEPMGADDQDGMVAFARELPEQDLLFLRMDITQPDVIAEWIRSIESGRRFTVIATYEGRIVGYGSLNRQDLLWMRHHGEIRIIVSPGFRGSGLGALLAEEVLGVARDAGLTKIVAQMPRGQAGARRVFRKLGFNLESMLTDWVIDLDGTTHDLVIMAYDVPR